MNLPSHMSTFTQQVYDVVRQIPAGKVLTYKEVATILGNPKAVRAVGTALSKNYNPEIPCHRVIKSNGTLGNYNRGGTIRKQEILREEGANV